MCSRLFAHKRRAPRIYCNEAHGLLLKSFHTGGIILKTIALLLLIPVLLCACGAAPTFETLGDVQHDMPSVLQKVCIQVPNSAEAFVEGDTTGWLAEHYSIRQETFEGQQLSETMQALCGFSTDRLTVMTSGTEDIRRYEWVWTAMSEEGQLLCRAAVIDDGRYHYCLIAEGSAEYGKELNEQWNEIFSSFSLEQANAA